MQDIEASVAIDIGDVYVGVGPAPGIRKFVRSPIGHVTAVFKPVGICYQVVFSISIYVGHLQTFSIGYFLLMLRPRSLGFLIIYIECMPAFVAKGSLVSGHHV